MPNHNLLHSLLVTDMVHWVHYTDMVLTIKQLLGTCIIILYNHTWLITHYQITLSVVILHFPKYLVGREVRVSR